MSLYSLASGQSDSLYRRLQTLAEFYPKSGPALLLALLLLPGHGNSADWIAVKESEGIRVFIREIPGSAIIMARGTVTIAAGPEAIASVLDDNRRHPEWIPYLKESRQLQALSDRERLEYNLFDAPWPASNRDFVFRVRATSGNGRRVRLYRMRSESSPLMPEREGVIRGVLHEGRFTLTRLPSGETEVELLFQADPKGWIPRWIVNLFQRVWPHKVLRGLRAQVLSEISARNQ